MVFRHHVNGFLHCRSESEARETFAPEAREQGGWGDIVSYLRSYISFILAIIIVNHIDQLAFKNIPTANKMIRVMKIIKMVT